ncbi:acetoacetate decarboxylase family protein [Mycolicibacterium vinylchloridicum]|uniref:acetoacetate decarboxylase family protein n=1 Tax=Mycolicibacterium vinylchloridicum TaxID=2736928 RepID=UPI002D7F5A72|nr:acetoacetate decarboxylase family protein [Mycolicibacterium vinylchloridicum]
MSKSFTRGVLNLSGARPEDAYPYDGPIMPRIHWYSVTIATSYEAIEKIVVPPPLKVNRDLPPHLQLSFFVNPTNLGFDGRHSPYQAFSFAANAVYGDVAGTAGWEMVDSVYTDKTTADFLIPWGVYFGFLKKFADIRATPMGGGNLEITVHRHGTQIIRMQIEVGAKLADEELAAMSAGAVSGAGALTVREIPNLGYTEYAERSIWLSPTSEVTVTDAWAAECREIEFGSIELDPFGDFLVEDVVGAAAYTTQTNKDFFRNARLVKQLPLVP